MVYFRIYLHALQWGRFSPSSQGADVEVMGNLNVSFSEPLDLPALLRSQCVSVWFPCGDVIWSLFSYDNNTDGQLLKCCTVTQLALRTEILYSCWLVEEI